MARVAIAADERVLCLRRACELAGEEVARLAVRARAVRRRPHAVVPGDNVAASVQSGAYLHRHRRALRLPAVLIVTHPLHAHGLADRLR